MNIKTKQIIILFVKHKRKHYHIGLFIWH